MDDRSDEAFERYLEIKKQQQTKLFPCPFCGNEVHIDYSVNEKVAAIVCDNGNCKGSGLLIAIGERDGGFEKAIAAWNSRA